LAIVAILALILYAVQPLLPWDLLRGAKIYEEGFRPSEVKALRFRDWYSVGKFGATEKGSEFEEIANMSKVWIRVSMERLPNFFNYSFDEGILLLKVPIAIPEDADIFMIYLIYNGSTQSTVAADGWEFFCSDKPGFVGKSSWEPSTMLGKFPTTTPSPWAINPQERFQEFPLPGDIQPAKLSIPESVRLGRAWRVDPPKALVFGIEMKALLEKARMTSKAIHLAIVPKITNIPADFSISLSSIELRVQYVLYGQEPPPESAAEVQPSVLMTQVLQIDRVVVGTPPERRALLAIGIGAAILSILLRRR